MTRLDIYLVENGLAKSRERAKAMIISGKVTVNSKVCSKPAYDVQSGDNVEAAPDDLGYVGRGGLKLAAAFEAFNIDVSGKVCADIGASTGGFTQCLLEHGAKLVYAVDVGHGQLDQTLVNDKRVVNCEGLNARTLTSDSFEHRPGFISVDLSFISLELVIRPLYDLLEADSYMVVLIKPQFEAGKQALSKNGIVRSQKDHISVLKKLSALFLTVGFDVKSITPSAITGGDGNIEYLALLYKTSGTAVRFTTDFSDIVGGAFAKFR